MQSIVRLLNRRSRWLKIPAAALLILSLCRSAEAAQDTFYVSDYGGTLINYNTPIDATNFVNDRGNTFSYSLNTPSGNWLQGLYDNWSDTRNFMNAGEMDCTTGFRFDTHGSFGYKPAASFYNAGLIFCGTNTGGNVGVYINASNIVNSGTIAVGFNGLARVGGNNLDFTAGTMTVQSLQQNNNAGISATGLTGRDTNGDWVPAFDLTANSALSSGPIFFNLNNSLAYFDLKSPNATNHIVRMIFLQNNSSNTVPANVYIDQNPADVGNGTAHVEWVGPYISPATGQPATNYLYLTDDYVQGSRTNILGYISPGVPNNYTFTETTAPVALGAPVAPSPVIPPYSVTDPVTNNIYSYVNAQLIGTSVSLSSVANGAMTNLPGRVEITASNELNLSLTTMLGMNYLLLKSTNQFDYDGQSLIASPYADIYLGRTNGTLAITNLVVASIPVWNGTVQAWSTRWFATDSSGATWDCRALLVMDTLNPVTAAQQQDFMLYSSNNIVVSDALNISRTLSLNCTNLLVSTNGVGNGSFSLEGELNLNSPTMFWATSLPRLRCLTNNGAIRTMNFTKFGTTALPYLAMVNTGTISNSAGTAIVSGDFENDGGYFSAGSGSFTVQSLTTTITNGTILAKGVFTNISDSLVFSGSSLQVGNSITLVVTNLLTDLGPTNGNRWSLGAADPGFGIAPGLILTLKPTAGDLLGTTITNIDVGSSQVLNIWAGQDRGYSNTGFSDNAAIGQLVLDARGPTPHTQYIFSGTGASNAMYVDNLQLIDYSTNHDASYNLTSIQFSNNLVIYYAQAMINGVSVAEKLNHKNNDHLRWVSSYAGQFSSVALVYPDGSTNLVNAALASSSDIDSDGDGIVNSADPTPVFLPSQVAFTMTIVNRPPLSARLQWTTIPHATNFIYFTTNLSSSVWLPLTNFDNFYYGANVAVTNSAHVNWFVSPQTYPGPATNVWVFDPVGINPRYYRVAVQSWLTYPY